MYTLIKAYVKDKGWTKADISNQRIDKLMELYSRIYLTLSHPEQGTFQVDLTKLYVTMGAIDRTRTIAGWLSSRDNGSLTADDPIRNLSEVMTLTVKDMWEYPVDVSIGNEGFSSDADVPYDSLTDVTIADKDSNLQHVAQLTSTSLVSVNGKLMLPQRIGDSVYLKNARRFIDTCDGILSLQDWDFSELGPLTYLPLTEENLTALPVSDVMRKKGKRRFKVTSATSLKSKYPIAVIDGQPQLIDNIVSVYDDTTAVITVDLDKIYLQLVNTPLNYRVGLKETDSRDSDIYTDNVDVYRFLTNGFSFITFIDAGDINFFTRPLGRTDIPGSFTYPYPPKGAAIDYRGNVIDYNIVGWDGVQASINTLTGFNPDYVHEHVPREERKVVSVAQLPSKEIMGGWMVNIYKLIE